VRKFVVKAKVLKNMVSENLGRFSLLKLICNENKIVYFKL